MMHLYIPTRGRVDYQHTIKTLPRKYKKLTIVVCPSFEVKTHRENHPGLGMVIAQPDPDMSIAAKRAWIFKEAKRRGHDKIMMLDDDVRFGLRTRFHKQMVGFDPPGLRLVKGSAWQKIMDKDPSYGNLETTLSIDDPLRIRLFDRIDWMLDTYRHGGVNARLQQHTFGCEFITNHRVQIALAYHVPTILENCELGRIEHREDFDYTLQLLRKGFPNAVYCWAVAEQNRGYNASGGASMERSMARSNADAHKLARLHPGFVKVGSREYVKSIPREEVTVYWKKAAEEGKNEFL